MSRIAFTQGWQFCEPVTLPHWDITNPVDFERSLQYIDEADPDLLLIAWPCTKWSPYQRLNARTQVQKRALEEARREQKRTFLRLSARAAASQRKRKKVVLGENPAPSLAWKEPEIVTGFDGLSHVQCDQCQYGLVHPETQQPIRKRTQFVGQPKVVKYLSKKCPGRHQHAHIEGNVRIDDLSVRLSTWCGAYPPALCRAILKGAEEFLADEERSEEVLYEEVFAEEKMMAGDDLVESDGDWAQGRESSDEETRKRQRREGESRIHLDEVQADGEAEPPLVMKGGPNPD